MELRLNQFTGPLDLLLGLLSEKKLEVSEVSLSEITEQYLEYLDNIEDNKAEELADFLMVAAKLLLLKSRGLMPQMDQEEDELSLEAQLRLYKAYVEASRKLNSLWLGGIKGRFRVEPARRSENFVWPSNVSIDRMHVSMLKLVSRLKPLDVLPQTSIDRAISMKEKIDRIRKILSSTSKMSFFDVVDHVENKTDMIVSFLALLELVKQQAVFLEQEGTFHDIVIIRA